MLSCHPRLRGDDKRICADDGLTICGEDSLRVMKRYAAYPYRLPLPLTNVEAVYAI